ncbi:GreA/GreB family elongation factor [Patescibacteria group bacterium]
MNNIRKEEILKLLDAEISKIQESAKKTDEASKQKLTGYSAAGDKYHAMGASDMAKSYLKRLESRLKDELKKAPDGTPEKVKTPCVVKLLYDDGAVNELILVENAVSLPSISFISVNSPLGRAILDRSINEVFGYNLDGEKKFSGKIISIN